MILAAGTTTGLARTWSWKWSVPITPTGISSNKRKDYAEAGIPEYWIANLIAGTLTVLVLSGGEYGEHGVFRSGEQADSPSLPGFSVDVKEMFDAV